MPDVRDLVAEISARFSAIEAELHRTRAELDEARRKLASYEGFDAGLRETIAAAVAKAQEELLPKLTALRDELARTELERDALRAEVGKLRDERSSLERTVSELRPEQNALRRASAEHLRGILTEVVAEMRKELASVERPREPRPAAPPPTVAAPTPATVAAPTPPTVAPPTHTAPAAPVARPPAAPAPEPSREFVEDVEELAPRGTPQRAPVFAALENEPHQIELVLRSVRSFPQLIAIENRIQSFPGVSRVYMHRTGVDGSATLTVQLEPQVASDAFAAELARSERPQITVDTVAGDQIEATVAG
ncbi:MAG TPA: hypothetical protein VFA01_00815 [Candidatus Dormibacteraeota bacterium]|jgi:hypothetical protein|nr:hypothetical protein [Candidatus Dormibacteraeota bacterium]